MSFSTLITAIEGDKPTFQDISDVLKLFVAKGLVVNLGTIAEDSTNVYTATSDPSIESYSEGQLFIGAFDVTPSSTTPTVNVDSLGAKTVKTLYGDAPLVNQLPADKTIVFYYDGTYLRALNVDAGDYSYTPSVGKSGSGSISSTTTPAYFARRSADKRRMSGYVSIQTTTSGIIDYLTVSLPVAPSSDYGVFSVKAIAQEASGAAKNILTFYIGGTLRLYGDASAVSSSWSAGTHYIYIKFDYDID